MEIDYYFTDSIKQTIMAEIEERITKERNDYFKSCLSQNLE